MCNLCFTYKTNYPNYIYCPACGDKLRDTSFTPKGPKAKSKPNTVKRPAYDIRGDRLK